MEYLTQWITQIIIFLIIAILIELLVPNKTMDKYIRFVIGLILVLLFLQPIFQLFQVNVDHVIEKGFTDTMDEINDYHTKNSLENIIEMEKSEIEAAQHAYILEEMAVQLKELADKSLRKKFHMQIKEIQFQFLQQEEKSYENLEEVLVTLEEVKGHKEGDVHEVDEITIHSKSSEKYIKQADEKKIISHLQEIWQLYDKKITVE